MTVREQYTKALKAAQKRRLYYQNNYGLALPEVQKTKRPTRASIRRLKSLYRGGEPKVSRTANRYYKRHPELTQATEPISQKVVFENKIHQILEDAYSSDNYNTEGGYQWGLWKVGWLENLIRERGLSYNDVEVIFEKADKLIESYIFDSTNAKNKEYINIQDTIIALLEDRETIAEVVYNYGEDDEAYYS